MLASACSSAAAQVTRLPPTDLTQPPYPGLQVLYPEVSDSPDLRAWPEPRPSLPVMSSPGCDPAVSCGPSLAMEEQLPPEHRSGFFQKALLDYAYFPRLGSGGMGMHEVQGKLAFAVPAPSVEWPLLIVPGYGVRSIDGPANADMPAQLHDAFVAFRWLPKFSPTLGLDVTASPGWYSDYQQSSRDAFRMIGYATGWWAYTPTTKLVLGVGYFDRLSVDWLPLGGIIWTPTERVNFEFIFPRPKFAWQLDIFGADGRLVKDWGYVAAEFGGGAWAVERSNGQRDLLDMSDYRLFMGLERNIRGGLESRIEAGYVFARKVQFKSRAPSFEPDDTLMLRAGLAY